MLLRNVRRKNKLRTSKSPSINQHQRPDCSAAFTKLSPRNTQNTRKNFFDPSPRIPCIPRFKINKPAFKHSSPRQMITPSRQGAETQRARRFSLRRFPRSATVCNASAVACRPRFEDLREGVPRGRAACLRSETEVNMSA